MEIFLWVLLAALVVLVGYVIMIYNNLVAIKNNVSMSWSNIDVLLKQRHDELPKLVATCQQYMKHERGTLEAITEARSKVMQARDKGDIGGLGAAETMLRGALGNLFAVVENYPELKADKSFGHLQQRISTLEETIADRREFYNQSVNINNVRIEQFPDNIIAGMFNFKHADLLEFSEEEKKDVNVGELFQS